MTDEQQKTPKDEPQKTPTSGRTLRRLRAQFRVELLGKAKPTPSDQTLIVLGRPDRSAGQGNAGRDSRRQ
jgi:hypothetical protein